MKSYFKKGISILCIPIILMTCAINLLHPYALLMEVTGYTPWRLEERLSIRDMVKKDSADCKVILIVDDVSEPQIAENVKNAKQSGLIDAFLFTSTTENYLVAVMDSL